MNIAIKYPSLAYDGEPTFAGVLRKYFIEWNDFGNNIGISKRWNDATKASYIRDYEERLIPALVVKHGAEKPLHSYSDSEIEEVLRDLKEKHHFAESTIRHYRNLFWVVYKAGYEHGHYADNLFWGDDIDLDSDDPVEREEIRQIVMTRTRRALSMEEERKFIEWFCSLDSEEADGEDIGLILMFFLGLRNNEACGADVKSVYLHKGARGIPVFDMTQSTEIGKNTVKGGGKTSNAPRTIPMFPEVYAFIERRRDFLAKLVEEGKIALTEEIKSVDNMPLVCRGKKYLTRASTTDLSKKGREFFDKIGISKRTIAVLHQVLWSDEFRGLQLDEKEPTTYLLRRAFATGLYNLGFQPAERQYIIGHDIEDTTLTREFFNDGDRLYDMWKRLIERPIKVFLEAYCREDPLAKKVRETIMSNAKKENTDELEFTSDNRANQLYEVQVEALEPGHSLGIEVIGDEGSKFDTTIRAFEPPVEYPRTVQIYEMQQEAYRRYLENYNSSRGM